MLQKLEENFWWAISLFINRRWWY